MADNENISELVERLLICLRDENTLALPVLRGEAVDDDIENMTDDDRDAVFLLLELKRLLSY